MGRRTFPALTFIILVMSLACFACSSSRYQQGFSYQPAYAGPDVATGQSEERITPLPTEETYQPINKNLAAAAESIVEAPAQTEVLAEIISKEYQENQQGRSSLNNREILHKMASQYATTQNKQLTSKQLRKLDRYADKMEKKQRRGAEDVNWGPANNLEWFILLGAGVALVVGILGIGFGWFIFLGLALVYLYLKLLKNN
jgi:hypothetical protein